MKDLQFIIGFMSRLEHQVCQLQGMREREMKSEGWCQVDTVWNAQASGAAHLGAEEKLRHSGVEIADPEGLHEWRFIKAFISG